MMLSKCPEIYFPPFTEIEAIPYKVEFDQEGAGVGRNSVIYDRKIENSEGKKIVLNNTSEPIVVKSDIYTYIDSDGVEREKYAYFKINWNNIRQTKKIIRVCDEIEFNVTFSPQPPAYIGPYDISPDGKKAIFRFYPNYVALKLNVNHLGVAEIVVDESLSMGWNNAKGIETFGPGKPYFSPVDNRIYSYSWDNSYVITEQDGGLIPGGLPYSVWHTVDAVDHLRLVRRSATGSEFTVFEGSRTIHSSMVSEVCFNSDDAVMGVKQVTQITKSITFPGFNCSTSYTTTVYPRTDPDCFQGDGPDGTTDHPPCSTSYPIVVQTLNGGSSDIETRQGTPGCVILIRGNAAFLNEGAKPYYYITPEGGGFYPGWETNTAEQANHNPANGNLTFDSNRGRWRSEFVAP